LQGEREARAEAEAAAEDAAEQVAAVQQQYEEALAQMARLGKERQQWQQDWDAERRRMEADKAALLASMEVDTRALQF
jgi:hypothetical protein